MEACNITQTGARRRAVLGVVLIGVGLGLGLLLIATGRPWFVRLGVVVVPLLFGSLSLLQAREKV